MNHEGHVATGIRAGRRGWVGLVTLALPTLLVSIDISVLLLAVPQLSSDLGATTVEQLWITDVYGFMIAGFLVTMGTLGDRMGRRKLLLIRAVALMMAFGPAAGLEHLDELANEQTELPPKTWRVSLCRLKCSEVLVVDG
jgi:DHA2 family multidrug resistance protein-like MFS transporter